MQAGGGPEAFLQRRELLRDVGRKGEAKRRCNFERRHRAQEVTLDCVMLATFWVSTVSMLSPITR